MLEFVGVDGFGANRDRTASLDDDEREFGWHLKPRFVTAFGAGEFQARLRRSLLLSRRRPSTSGDATPG